MVGGTLEFTEFDSTIKSAKDIGVKGGIAEEIVMR